MGPANTVYFAHRLHLRASPLFLRSAKTTTSSSNSSDRLGFAEKLGYGVGDTASNFFFFTFNILLLGYYTDVLGLAAGAVGTMFLVTKLFDAITDPVMGMSADRTRSRWGKFRPYILWVAVPFGVIGYSMFANPDFSSSGKLIYAYVTYSLMMLAYTAINVPYSSLLGVISANSEERTTVSAYRFVCAFGAQLLISAFIFPLREALISVFLWFVTFFTTRERVAPPADQSIDLKNDLGVVVRNGAWIVLIGVAVLTLTNVGVRGGATYFYVKYYMADSEKMVFWIFDRTSVAWLSGGLAMLLGTLLTKPLTNRFDKSSLMIWLTAVNGLSMLAILLVQPHQYWLMIAMGFVGTIIVGPTPAIVWSMYADVADYGEWEFGRRTTGLIFSGLLFSQKMGLAFGAGLSGWILGGFGFQSGEVQSSEALMGIRLMFSVFPGVHQHRSLDHQERGSLRFVDDERGLPAADRTRPLRLGGVGATVGWRLAEFRCGTPLVVM